MANTERDRGSRRWSAWRIAGWSFPVVLLLLPLIAKAPWTLSDFIIAGVLFGSVGLAFEFIVRRSSSLSYRFGAGFAIITAFLTLWVNGAVGMIGSEDNPMNLMFGGVLFIALIGAVLARLEPVGMTRAMVVAAIAQAVAGAAGLTTDVRGAIFSMAFAGLWLLSAAFFWNASQERTTAGAR